MAYYDYQQMSTRPKALEPVFTAPGKGSYITSAGEKRTFDNDLARKNLSTRMAAEEQRREDIYYGERAIEEGRQHISTLEAEHQKALLEYQGALARGFDDGTRKKKADDLFNKINKTKEWYAGWDDSQAKLAELKTQVQAEEQAFQAGVTGHKAARSAQAEAEAKRQQEKDIQTLKNQGEESRAAIEARAKLIAERSKNQLIIDNFKSMDENSLEYETEAPIAFSATRANKWIESQLDALSGRSVKAVEKQSVVDDQGRSVPGAIIKPEDKQTRAKDDPTAKKTVIRTGTIDGKKVVMFSDGSVDYADTTTMGPENNQRESAKSSGNVTKLDQRYTVGELFGEVFQRPNADIIKQDLRRELGLSKTSKEQLEKIVINGETLRNLWARALQEGKDTANLYRDMYMAFLGQPTSNILANIRDMKIPLSKE